MTQFWKIPKVWVQDWGLSWIEAGVLADILSYPSCSFRERASRCGVSIGKISACIATFNEKQICSKIEHASVHILNNLCSNYEQNRSKYEQIKKEKESSPLQPPIKKNKKREEQEDITLTNVSVPNADASAPEISDKKKKKKYSPEEQKLHVELRDIFCEEWEHAHKQNFYWTADAMKHTIKIADQIKFHMADKDDAEALRLNFRVFVKKIFTCGDGWLFNNATPRVIASKFNEIYSQLTNKRNGTKPNSSQGGISADYIERAMREAAGAV